MYSNDEDSDDDYDNDDNEFYYRRCQMLLERCESIQRNNETLVHRIRRINKFTRRLEKQKIFIMNWLDKYDDDWRNADHPLDIGVTDDGTYVDLLRNEFANNSLSKENDNELNEEVAELDSKQLKKKKIKKRKQERSEKDPNAPKKPANSFLQFCQEQRPNVVQNMITTNHCEPSKQDLAKQLAANWNDLSEGDKKVYYEKYTKSREQYIVNMIEYTTNKAKMEQEANASATE